MLAPHDLDPIPVPPHMTRQQRDRLVTLCVSYGVEFDPMHYQSMFDLPHDYVAGWVGGRPGTIFVGVSPEGEASS